MVYSYTSLLTQHLENNGIKVAETEQLKHQWTPAQRKWQLGQDINQPTYEKRKVNELNYQLCHIKTNVTYNKYQINFYYCLYRWRKWRVPGKMIQKKLEGMTIPHFNTVLLFSKTFWRLDFSVIFSSVCLPPVICQSRSKPPLKTTTSELKTHNWCWVTRKDRSLCHSIR